MIRTISITLFLFLLLGISAAAQKDAGAIAASTPAAPTIEVSLKTLPASQRYTDTDKTFSIWMPAVPKSATVTPPSDPIKGSTKTQIKWDVAEGFFAITKSKYEHRTFDAEADVTSLLNLVKENVMKAPSTKLVLEKPVSYAKWRGSDMVFTSGEWIKTLVRVLAAGNEVYIVTATVNHHTPDAEKLLLTAISSLEIKAPVADKIK